jgi:hypothetical protein
MASFIIVKASACDLDQFIDISMRYCAVYAL